MLPRAKKKLFLVITKGTWGGAQRYVFDLARSLASTYAITIVAGTDGRLFREARALGIRTIHIPTLERDVEFGGDVKACIELMRLFRAERPDIVHLNSAKAGGVGALAARLAHVPRIIYTVHGWAFNEPVTRSVRLFRLLMSFLTQTLVHQTIAVSHFDALLAPLKSRTITIHNGIAPQQFLSRDEARAVLSERAQIPPDTFVFGAIAEHHTNKGLDILIEAAFLVDGAHIVIIGDGEERERLIEKISELSLGDRVHLVGFIENASRLIPAFDTYILPSRKEGLPYVVLEAGLAGVPVIATAVGGVPEIITDQVSGDLVHAFNDLALAESMTEFLTLPNTRARYAEALRERIQRDFTLDRMIRETSEVYEG